MEIGACIKIYNDAVDHDCWKETAQVLSTTKIEVAHTASHFVFIYVIASSTFFGSTPKQKLKVNMREPLILEYFHNQ